MESERHGRTPTLSVDVKATNPHLLKAMGLHRQGGYQRETFQAFLALLAESILLVPTPNAPVVEVPELHIAGPQGVEVQVFMQQTTDGKNVLSVFTDEAALVQYRDPAPAYHELFVVDLFDLAQQFGANFVVVNPGDSDSVAVNSSYFAELAAGHVRT